MALRLRVRPNAKGRQLVKDHRPGHAALVGHLYADARPVPQHRLLRTAPALACPPNGESGQFCCERERAPIIGRVSRPMSDEKSLCRPYATCHISAANSAACASIEAGHRPDARASQSPSSGTSSVPDLADAASSVGAGQDRCSVTTIETTAPRRARHRGQRSKVRKVARTWTLSPQLGQCIYDKRISSTRLYMSAEGLASAPEWPTSAPVPRSSARPDRASSARSIRAWASRPYRSRGCCIRFYRVALRPAQFDVWTRTSASRP